MKEAKDHDPGNLGLAGYAKLLCSAIFVTGTEEEAAREHCRNVAVDLIKLPQIRPTRYSRFHRLRGEGRPRHTPQLVDSDRQVLRGSGLHHSSLKTTTVSILILYLSKRIFPTPTLSPGLWGICYRTTLCLPKLMKRS